MSTKPNPTGRTYHHNNHHYRHNNHQNRSNQTNHLSKAAKYSPKNATRDPNHNGTARNDGQPSTSNHGGRKSTGGNMKSKRLPWNTDIIKDRFTPQPYHIQLMDYYLYSSRFDANFLILMQNDEWKNYLKSEFVRYYHQHYQQCSRTTAKLAIFITNMGSDVSKYVELISRHTTVKLAGVDQHFIASPETLLTLKQDANLFIMSVTVLVEWLRRGLLLLDEIGFIIFNDVNGAFQHNQDSYEQLMNLYVRPNLVINHLIFQCFIFVNLIRELNSEFYQYFNCHHQYLNFIIKFSSKIFLILIFPIKFRYLIISKNSKNIFKLRS